MLKPLFECIELVWIRGHGQSQDHLANRRQRRVKNFALQCLQLQTKFDKMLQLNFQPLEGLFKGATKYYDIT